MIDIGDRVVADGADEIAMTVTAYTQRKNSRMVECSYFFDGHSQVAWIEDWRLERAE
jgi:hypothetical protein